MSAQGPELSGTLAGLEVLGLSDLPRYRHAVARGEPLGFSYYFPFLLARHREGRRAVLIGEEDDSLCLYYWRIGRRDAPPQLDLLVAPTPLQLPVLERALERANAFNGDRSARVLRLDERDAAMVASLPRLRVSARHAQYLYRPADLAGRRFRTLRRNVQRVESLEGLEVASWTPADTPDCHELLVRWRRHHRATHGTAGGVATTRRLLDLAGALQAPALCGQVVRLDGRLVAFAFGGEIRPGLGCFFEAKSDPGIPGLSYFQRHRFLARLADFELVNDGVDLGRPGLRQLKQSLRRPVAMHVEHRARQRRA